MARALEIQGVEFLTMAAQATYGRQKERTLFADEHQRLINELLDRELLHENLKEQLKTTLGQFRKIDLIAKAQETLAREKKNKLDSLQEETVKGLRDPKGKLERPGLEQLEKEQEKVFKLRMLLRDANR